MHHALAAPTTYLEAAVDKRFVQIEDEAFLALESGRYGTEQVLLRFRSIRHIGDLTLHSMLPFFQWRRRR